MTRKLFAIVFTCCAMSLLAQDAIKVNYKGVNPTICDFAQALLADNGEEDNHECEGEAMAAIANAWEHYIKGEPQEEDVTFTVDQRNGYICYKYIGEEFINRIELCYWNEADQKHKLVACNITLLDKRGYSVLGQYDGISFYRYNNATKTMRWYYETGLDKAAPVKDGEWQTYNLPQAGKNITVTIWNENGPVTQFPVKWTGSKFVR